MLTISLRLADAYDRRFYDLPMLTISLRLADAYDRRFYDLPMLTPSLTPLTPVNLVKGFSFLRFHTWQDY